MIRFLCICIILLCSLASWAQSEEKSDTIKKTRINIIHADKLYRDPSISTAQILKGNVLFEHQGTFMNCDSALLFMETNSFEAYSNIKVNQGDTITITGDSLQYFGETKLALLRGNIFMKDKDLELNTSALDYDMNTGVGTYTNGATIISSENENKLVSNIGTYDSKTSTLFFKDSVKLTNPEYTIDSDTLVYDTEYEISYFHGPTYIRSKENLIYCEHGWYDSQHEESSFWQNAYIDTKEQKLEGDSIYYNRNEGIGEAFCNVQITDTTNKIIINGDYAYYNEEADSSLITGHALFTQFEAQDTLYMRADTLTIKMDSIDSLTQHQALKAFYHVLIYKNDLQAKCDSLVYNDADSLMKFFGDPIIWSEQNQLSGEFIQLKTNDGKIENLLIEKLAFIISEVDTVNFNQIKGKKITGKFTNNELTRVFVEGNGETIYFMGEDKKPVTDMNQSICSNIVISLVQSEIQEIKFLTAPSAEMKPLKSIQDADKKLAGFKWEIENRPLSKEDLMND